MGVNKFVMTVGGEGSVGEGGMGVLRQRIEMKYHRPLD